MDFWVPLQLNKDPERAFLVLTPDMAKVFFRTPAMQSEKWGWNYTGGLCLELPDEQGRESRVDNTWKVESGDNETLWKVKLCNTSLLIVFLVFIILDSTSHTRSTLSHDTHTRQRWVSVSAPVEYQYFDCHVLHFVRTEARTGSLVPLSCTLVRTSLRNYGE